MAKYLKYYGEFASVEGHSNRVSIYQESATPFEPREITFPADSPLTIEWGEKEKHEVLLGSSCTLRVCTSADMQFEDMYQIKYGECRIDVYRDGEFYWTGCLDTEFYEIQYETWNGEMSITFSDFNHLSGERFDMGVGFKSIGSIILQAIRKTGCMRLVRYSDFDESFEYSESENETVMPTTDDWYLSTKIVGGSAKKAPNLYVRTDNFCDETGEWKTWAEVLESVLTPLNVRMTQIGGFLFLYDLNGLYESDGDLTEHEIYWTSDRQDESYDVTYNNIRITYSPYAQSDNLMPTGCWSDGIDTPAGETAIDLLDGKTDGDATYFSYPLYPAQLYESADPSIVSGFTMWTSSECKNIELASRKKVFKFVPQYDGSECEGVMLFWRSAKYQHISWGPVHSVSYKNKRFGIAPFWRDGVTSINYAYTLFSTPRVIIPPQTLDDELQLRLKMECLVDVRVNPFEAKTAFWEVSDNQDYSMKEAMDLLNAHANFLYIPLRLCFKPVGTNDVYYYDNSAVLNQPFSVTSIVDTGGHWSKSADNVCYLSYYLVDAGERRGGSALCKWSVNRQTINRHYSDLTTMMQKMEDGQYITYPKINDRCVSGQMWIEVLDLGWIVCNAGDQQLGNAEHLRQSGYVANAVSFVGVKLPELEIINNNQFDQDLAVNDIVYNAEVNANARELLEINTTSGTAVDSVPTARGAYFNEDGKRVKMFYRQSTDEDGKKITITGTAEELLCGTLFSQYHDRHICLTGECRLGTKRYLSFTERLQDGKKFICVSEVQDLRSDTMDAKYIELTPDIYTKR